MALLPEVVWLAWEYILAFPNRVDAETFWVPVVSATREASTEWAQCMRLVTSVNY